MQAQLSGGVESCAVGYGRGIEILDARLVKAAHSTEPPARFNFIRHLHFINGNRTKVCGRVHQQSPRSNAMLYMSCACPERRTHSNTVDLAQGAAGGEVFEQNSLAEGQFRLGATGTNPNIPATTCVCGGHVRGSDKDHTISCNRLNGSCRHDYWKDALSAVATALLAQIQGGGSSRPRPSISARAGARTDIEARLPQPHGPALLDVSITHPRATTYVAGAAARQGSDAEKRDPVKRREHNGQHPSYSFISASVEAYGYVGKPPAYYIKTISEVAAGRGATVTKGSFLASIHCELSIALVCCQGAVHRGCANLFA